MGASSCTLAILTAVALRQRRDKRALHVVSQGVNATFGGDGGRPLRDLLAWLAACEPLELSAGGPEGSVSPQSLRLPRDVVRAAREVTA